MEKRNLLEGEAGAELGEKRRNVEVRYNERLYLL
jgi:hypothetical protein